MRNYCLFLSLYSLIFVAAAASHEHSGALYIPHDNHDQTELTGQLIRCSSSSDVNWSNISLKRNNVSLALSVNETKAAVEERHVPCEHNNHPEWGKLQSRGNQTGAPGSLVECSKTKKRVAENTNGGVFSETPGDRSDERVSQSPEPAIDAESPLMLDLPKIGTDPTQINFFQLPRVPSQHAMISDVRDRGGNWVHQHAYLAYYEGRYWAMWSDGPGVKRGDVSAEEHRNVRPGHDQPGTRVSYATSKDGLTWSDPGDLSGPPRIEGFGWIARGLWVRKGELLALASHFNAPGYPGKGLSLEAFRWNSTTNAWEAHGTVLDDTLNNFPPKKLPSGRFMMTRRDHERQVSLMIGGVSAFDHWEIRPLASYNEGNQPEEPYWYVLPDGKTLVGLLRDNSRSGRLLRTFSTDNGQTWAPIVKTNFPDATSKFFVLRTSRGYYAMVSNANPRGRDPLTLAISKDGLTFTHLFYLIGGRKVDYPHIIEKDDNLLIAFSGAKQTMEVLTVSLDDIDKLID